MCIINSVYYTHTHTRTHTRTHTHTHSVTLYISPDHPMSPTFGILMHWPHCLVFLCVLVQNIRNANRNTWKISLTSQTSDSDTTKYNTADAYKYPSPQVQSDKMTQQEMNCFAFVPQLVFAKPVYFYR